MVILQGKVELGLTVWRSFLCSYREGVLCLESWGFHETSRFNTHKVHFCFTRPGLSDKLGDMLITL